MSFTKCLKVDFYKFYHSNIIKIHLIIPIITLVFFLSYYKISPLSELNKVTMYVQLISMSFPLIISIIVNMVYEQEEEAKFQYYLSIANKRCIPHFSKLISILILGLISTLITILGFGIVFNMMGNILINIDFYLKQSFVIFGSNIILYMLQYLVVFLFNKGASIGLGIIGSLISALMLTGIGDSIWMIIPWAYSIRLSSYFTLAYVNNFILKEEIIMGSIIMMIFIIILLGIQIMFSNRFEGRKEGH